MTTQRCSECTHPVEQDSATPFGRPKLVVCGVCADEREDIDDEVRVAARADGGEML